MKKKTAKRGQGFLLGMLVIMLCACGSVEKDETMASAVPTEETGAYGTGEEKGESATDAQGTAPVQEAERTEEGTETFADSRDDSLEALEGLLGMDDAQAAEQLGGGQENWTEDQQTFIGRIYQAELFGETYPVYTSYDTQNLVNSVSVWISSGEREVTEEEVQGWVERLTAFAGVDPSGGEVSSESGSINWRWFLGDKDISLNWLENNLTISMNVVMGELK